MEDTDMEDADMEAHDSDGEFAFETDHLALRSSKDYCELIKYIVKLEAQKIQALKDIEMLAETKKKVLEDPVGFVDQLKSGETSFPSRQVVADLPNINWSRYGIDTCLDTDSSKDMKPSKEDLDFGMKVRGRMFTDNKPESFNQLWSCEEQKRLEELLEIYPEEAVESRRYRKIAQALGTRTPIQVMSRLQKYFAKLAKAGLHIPGRAPKKIIKDKAKLMFYKKSTFFPQLHVPVNMDDSYDSSETNEKMPLEPNSTKYALEMLKAAKEQRLLDETCPVYQIHTMCVGCHKQGFLGARWTDNTGTDYCTDCVVKILPHEKLIPVRQPVNK